MADDQERVGKQRRVDERVGDAPDGLVGFGQDDRRVDVELDREIDGRQPLQFGHDQRPLCRFRLVLAPHFRALGNLRLQRRDVELGAGFELAQRVDDVVARRRGGRRGWRLRARGRRREGRQRQRQTDPAPGTAHQRYPASTVAWVQFRLTPLAVIRHGTDLEVSLVEPWHSLMISSRQDWATMARAPIRFWIWSNGTRKLARHCGEATSWLRDRHSLSRPESRLTPRQLALISAPQIFASIAVDSANVMMGSAAFASEGDASARIKRIVRPRTMGRISYEP